MQFKSLFYVVTLGTFLAPNLTNAQLQKASSLTQWVDPHIGTGGHGHVFVGANVPYGAVQLGPNNISNGWDWVSGYHISDTTILGFAHTHLSGTGIGDLGDIVLLPFTGEVTYKRGNHSDQNSGAYSKFNRKTEKVSPGYYKVHLDRFGVNVELTATQRVGFHHYSFPKGKTPKILINLDTGTGWEGEKQGRIIVENDHTVSGYRYSKGWAKNQKIYFYAVFSKPFQNFKLADSTTIKQGDQITAKSAYGEFTFDENSDDLYVKVAVSPVSIENAKLNLNDELPDWDFENTRTKAAVAWEDQLSKIQIVSSNPKQKKIFYTALYHTMIAPSLFNDVNGQYIGADFKIHQLIGGENYTIFPMWDTYRAGHPLMNIIHRERVPDMINSMLRIYQQQGKLPVWHLAGNETDCMVGNPAINVVADAYLKGIGGFDKTLAYEAMKTSSMLDERGMAYYKKFGYVPFDKEEIESVAKGLEYGISDWSLAQVAKMRNENEDYNYFLRRSKAYSYYFDKNLQFIRGKDSKGNWRPGGFDPFHSAHMANDYTEGNAWQYTWLVPHDVNNFVRLFGSEDKFIKKLDSLFIADGNLGTEASPDISGLIGQYAHGNEPSHHVLYLYNFVGQPYKTAKLVRKTLSELYSDAPDGLSGNEDVGQMSAWYILSSLGFYQVSPAGGPFIFGSPLFEKATIRVGENSYFVIKTRNNSDKNIYIQSAKLNGKPYTKSFIEYKDIISGGTLEFVMGDKPSSSFGIDKINRPISVE